MGKIKETSLIIKKETIYDKIRKRLVLFIFQKDYETMQRLEQLTIPQRPNPASKIIIPKEIGKDIKKI